MEYFNYMTLLQASEWATVLTPFGIGVIWLLRLALRLRDDMKALRENHLPHIYYVLSLICKRLNIDFEGKGQL